MICLILSKIGSDYNESFTIIQNRTEEFVTPNLCFINHHTCPKITVKITTPATLKPIISIVKAGRSFGINH